MLNLTNIDGSDAVTIGSKAPLTGGTLAGIKGAINLQGSGNFPVAG